MMRRALPCGLRVVLYHHLTDRPTDLVDRIRVSTRPALFEAHVRRLARDHDVVCLDDVLSGRLPKRPLLITFDDGYRSVLDVAAPILERLGLPSVFFVSADFLAPGSLPLDNLLCWLTPRVGIDTLAEAVAGRPATGGTVGHVLALIAELPYARRLRLGDELAERFGVDRASLRDASGLFLDHTDLSRLAHFDCEVGNHTRSHLFCRAIASEDEGEAELVQHRLQLEEWTGAAVRSFSYPYGYQRDATPLVERLLARSGHEARFLVESRCNARHASTAPWSRVSLHDRPVGRLGLELAVLPHLRTVRDRLAS